VPDSSPNILQQPVTVLYGVGPERAAQLERLNIRSVEDLLLHRPTRHEDRRHFQRVADLELRQPGLVCGKIVASGVKYWSQHKKSVYEFILEDGSGRLHCRWWNLSYMERYFKTGDSVVVYGKPVGLKPRTMDHPETEVLEDMEQSLHLNRMVPVYPLTEGLPQRWLRSLLWQTLELCESQISEPHPGWIPETYPTRSNALRMLHFPEVAEDIELARKRLALDEFLELQRAIQSRRQRMEARAGARNCHGDNRLIRPFLAELGFELTEAQTSVLKEIRADMAGPHPMRRLLQGDVGSGKTVVAACVALMALESGCDVALMAPTEILAEQHARNFERWLQPRGIPACLITGSRKTRPSGSGPVFYVGTHALLESAFAPENLGLVIIDEQHKFGVAQREQLVRKGDYPHLLVMTATPIPRTLGLTLYGDLDVSVIDKSPGGRGVVKTFVRGVDRLPKVWDFIRSKLAEGRQGYVVYSRLEEEDASAGLKAVAREFDKLQKIFDTFHLGLLHGRMSAVEKDRVMEAFRVNEIQLLVATSIVEVGLDVPNATVMLVENAEQFGLAQLHQLRGRIGRGAGDSWCILCASGKTPESGARLRIMAETSDGFRIAEEDLKLRGPGELLGREQSGMPSLRFGDLARDYDLIVAARGIVREHRDAAAPIF
jgi:ATP-dependent DNA helicase RecG